MHWLLTRFTCALASAFNRILTQDATKATLIVWQSSNFEASISSWQPTDAKALEIRDDKVCNYVKHQIRSVESSRQTKQQLATRWLSMTQSSRLPKFTQIAKEQSAIKEKAREFNDFCDFGSANNRFHNSWLRNKFLFRFVFITQSFKRMIFVFISSKFLFFLQFWHRTECFDLLSDTEIPRQTCCSKQKGQLVTILRPKFAPNIVQIEFSIFITAGTKQTATSVDT